MVLSFISLGQNLYAQEAEKEIVYVKGMVCAFCAQGIERRFKREEEIKDILVELEDHKVTLVYHPGKSLDRERISSLLRSAGYSLDSDRHEQ